MTPSQHEQHFYHEVESNYGDVEQRWLIVLSDPRRQQELAQLERRIRREQDKLTKIAQSQQASGKYIIATNVLDKLELPAEELLSVYKEQNCKVERGFRFLKDPFFSRNLPPTKFR